MQQLWWTIFGNNHPVEVEVGAGTGTFILPAARRFVRVNFFGIERSRSRAQRLEEIVDARRLQNVRVVAADAACVVSTLIPAASVQAYHVYFPDPWWKRRHHRRRLFTPSFGQALARTLIPGGRVYVATDVDDTFALIQSILAACTVFTRDAGAHAVRPAATAFERKGLARGDTIKEAVFVKSSGAERFRAMDAQGFEMAPEHPS